MNLNIIRGDLFESESDVIAHGVNCQGVMGAGVAGLVRQRYPSAYNDYARLYGEGRLIPGKAFFSAVGPPPGWIVHLCTQYWPGADAKPSWIAASLVSAATVMAQCSGTFENPKRIAIPQIGCGIGGLTWREVESIILCCGWDDFTVDVYVL